MQRREAEEAKRKEEAASSLPGGRLKTLLISGGFQK